MKKLIPALCMLLIAAAMLGTSTYAWFSMNKTVTATGMQVKATTAESLVISNQAPVGTAVTHAFTSAATELTPSTHDSTYATFATGLKYVENTEDVDASTGVAASYTFQPAANGGGTNYYVDYVVYVASSGAAMTDKKLTFAFDSTTKTYVAGLAADGTKDTEKAITADIYVESLTNKEAASTFNATTYIGKIELANAATAEASTGSMTIPVNGSSATSWIRITFRIYLDGDLEKSSGQKYVYNDKIDTTEVEFGIAITVGNAT